MLSVLHREPAGKKLNYLLHLNEKHLEEAHAPSSGNRFEGLALAGPDALLDSLVSLPSSHHLPVLAPPQRERTPSIRMTKEGPVHGFIFLVLVLSCSYICILRAHLKDGFTHWILLAIHILSKYYFEDLRKILLNLLSKRPMPVEEGALCGSLTSVSARRARLGRGL